VADLHDLLGDSRILTFAVSLTVFSFSFQILSQLGALANGWVEWFEASMQDAVSRTRRVNRSVRKQVIEDLVGPVAEKIEESERRVFKSIIATDLIATLISALTFWMIGNRNLIEAVGIWLVIIAMTAMNRYYRDALGHTPEALRPPHAEGKGSAN
jgi:hypothetical protein